MSQRKVYIEHTHKSIKVGNIIASILIVVGVLMLFGGKDVGISVVLIGVGILMGWWYKIKQWWMHS
jgi:hypothetical protein